MIFYHVNSSFYPCSRVQHQLRVQYIIHSWSLMWKIKKICHSARESSNHAQEDRRGDYQWKVLEILGHISSFIPAKLLVTISIKEQFIEGASQIRRPTHITFISHSSIYILDFYATNIHCLWKNNLVVHKRSIFITYYWQIKCSWKVIYFCFMFFPMQFSFVTERICCDFYP